MTQSVLITRPSGQSDGLLQTLTEAGFEVEQVPAMVIEAIDDRKILRPAINAVLALDHYQHVIFISTNAVRYGMGLVDQYWPQWPLKIHWHAIGQATAKALSAFDIETAEPAHISNSEALLQSPLLHNITGHKVVIFRGQGGREHLAEQLRARGATVDYAEVYSRRIAEENSAELQRLLTSQGLSSVVALSGETLDNLCRLAQSALPLLQALPVIVPGQRVARIAQNLGFNDIIITTNAAATTISAALQQCQD